MKNFIYTSLIVTVTLLVQSCAQEPPYKRSTFAASPMDTVYSQIRPQTQTFTLKHNEAQVITTEGGTKLMVPANGFVDRKGNPVEGNIQLEVIEAFDLDDFITSGLTTTSDGKLLLSGGMMNINATANGSDLELASGSEINIVMPLMDKKDYQIFTGDLGENGINWQIDSTAQEQDYLIPVSLNLLYPDTTFYWTEWLYNHNIANKKDSLYLKSGKYENTLMATMELRDRTGFIDECIFLMSYADNGDYYSGKSNYKANMTVMDLYMNNPDKPIEELDSLAFIELKEHFDSRNKDYNTIFEKHQQKYGYGFLYWHDDSLNTWEEWKNWYVALVDTYLLRLPGKGKVKVIDDRGVDLNSPNAYADLLAKGVPDSEIQEILSYNIKREAIIEKLKREKQAIEDRKKVHEIYETTAFSIKKLGWINCDRFYDDPSAAPAEILLSNTGTQLDFIDYSLVIPKLNVRLGGYVWDNGQYAFTKKEGPYTKLPIGTEAVIVGVSLKGNEVFYASKKITIKEKLKLDMNMQPIAKTALSDSLASCLLPS